LFAHFVSEFSIFTFTFTFTFIFVQIGGVIKRRGKLRIVKVQNHFNVVLIQVFLWRRRSHAPKKKEQTNKQARKKERKGFNIYLFIYFCLFVVVEMGAAASSLSDNPPLPRIARPPKNLYVTVSSGIHVRIELLDLFLKNNTNK
jgi:hypothetical protein